MTPDPAIRIEGVSKVYVVGARRFEDVRPFWRRDRGPDRREADDVDDEDDELLVEEEPQPEEPAREPGVIAALTDIDLELAPGTRLALLGDAGAGKSTLLKLLGRITPPTTGRIEIRGRVIPLLEVASGLMNPDVSGRRNAITVAALFGVRRRVVERHLDAIAAMAGVEGRIGHAARTYSARQYRRLGLAVALHLEGDIVLVDDRVLAGDPEFTALCARRLHEIVAGGATLLMAANDPAAVAPYCDEAIWMSQGRILDRRPLPGAGEAARALGAAPRRSADAAAGGLGALGKDDRALIEELVVRGRSYADVAAAEGSDATAVSRRAHDAFAVLAPDGGRLTAEQRGAVVDHLLGQARGTGPQAVFAAPEARVWARMLHWYLDPLAPAALPAVPSGVGASAPEGVAGGPEVDESTTALVAFIQAAYGERRAQEALTVATDKAIWKELRRVKWGDVGEAAGLPHEDVKEIVGRLVQLRTFAAAPAHTSAFDGRVALLGARLHDREGNDVSVLGAGAEAIVEVVVESTVPGPELLLGVVLEGPHARPVRLAQPEPFVAETPGRYHVRAHLSGRALGETSYTARVTVRVRLGGQESRLERADAFAFDVDLDDGVGWEEAAPVSWEVSA